MGIDLWLCFGGAVIGTGLGVIYFSGLWLTLRLVPGSRHPVVWVMGSFVSRLAIALTVFYGLIQLAGPVPSVLALVCFLVVRMLMVKRLGHFENRA
ncbi:MAG: ATP synthase subunit I [Candidatus Competibacteraceae bacterium]|jgi:F1F0 ATPase subunit 2|nr:ATP synthase subunit I [Candidatus Competibacteraceae bacterium]